MELVSWVRAATFAALHGQSRDRIVARSGGTGPTLGRASRRAARRVLGAAASQLPLLLVRAAFGGLRANDGLRGRRMARARPHRLAADARPHESRSGPPITGVLPVRG